jgi:hypothetical protein
MTQTVRETLAELLAPTTNRFVRDQHASLRQDEFDIPQAQTGDMIQPDRMADDFGGKAVTIMWVGSYFHSPILTSIRPVYQRRLR